MYNANPLGWNPTNEQPSGAPDNPHETSAHGIDLWDHRTRSRTRQDAATGPQRPQGAHFPLVIGTHPIPASRAERSNTNNSSFANITAQELDIRAEEARTARIARQQQQQLTAAPKSNAAATAKGTEANGKDTRKKKESKTAKIRSKWSYYRAQAEATLAAQAERLRISTGDRASSATHARQVKEK
jgi:hypothetical protein